MTSHESPTAAGAELDRAVLGAYVLAVIFFACLIGGGRCSCRVDSRPSNPTHAEAPR